MIDGDDLNDLMSVDVLNTEVKRTGRRSMKRSPSTSSTHWYMIYVHVVLLYLLLKTLQAYLFLA